MMPTPHRYYVHTMPGLESVAGEELKARFPEATIESYKRIPERNGLALFTYAGDAADLLALRTIEDLFVVAARFPKVPWGHEGLSAIYEGLSKADDLLGALTMALPRPPKGRPLAPTFRVIARLITKNPPYRRLDFQQSIEKAIERHTRGKWRADREEGLVEVWANLIGFDFICGVRLSSDALRHREYKQEHLPASLRPSVAAALVWLTAPRAEDAFLDPFCGAGTVLIERALAARHRLLLGGDRDEQALAAAMENIGPRHKPRQLFQWDATRLPLAADSIDAMASNLPFGVQIGSPREMPTLYRSFVREMARVLSPRGRAALLSGQGNLLGELLKAQGEFAIERTLPVEILGRRATIVVARRLPH